MVCQFKSSPELDRPDIQGIFAPAIDTSRPAAEFKPAHDAGVLFEGIDMRPTTASSVHLGGRLPENAPIIDARFFEDEGDRAAFAPVLGIARELFAKSPLADYVLEEEFPGPAVSSPDQVLRYAFDTGGIGFHAVGACAMGPESDDVVDPRLRVRGVDGLRVVAASVLPVQVAATVRRRRWRSPGSPPTSSSKTQEVRRGSQTATRRRITHQPSVGAGNRDPGRRRSRRPPALVPEASGSRRRSARAAAAGSQPSRASTYHPHGE